MIYDNLDKNNHLTKVLIDLSMHMYSCSCMIQVIAHLYMTLYILYVMYSLASQTAPSQCLVLSG